MEMRKSKNKIERGHVRIAEIAPDIAFVDYEGERVHYGDLEALVPRDPQTLTLTLPHVHSNPNSRLPLP